MDATSAKNLAPFLIRDGEASALLSVSKRHFANLQASGQIGPLPIHLGRSKLWNVDELRRWSDAGCPPRRAWSEHQNVVLAEGARK